MIQYPHCDSRILHRPGDCDYCDEHPDWQAMRLDQRIAFSGHEPREGELACPADQGRDPEVYNRWPGNQAVQDTGWTGREIVSAYRSDVTRTRKRWWGLG